MRMFLITAPAPRTRRYKEQLNPNTCERVFLKVYATLFTEIKTLYGLERAKKHHKDFSNSEGFAGRNHDGLHSIPSVRP